MRLNRPNGAKKRGGIGQKGGAIRPLIWRTVHENVGVRETTWGQIVASGQKRDEICPITMAKLDSLWLSFGPCPILIRVGGVFAMGGGPGLRLPESDAAGIAFWL